MSVARAFERKAMMEDMEDEDNLSTAMAIGLIRRSISSEMNQQLDEDYSKLGIAGAGFETDVHLPIVVEDEDEELQEEAGARQEKAGGMSGMSGSGGGGGVRCEGFDDARELFERREPSSNFSASEMYAITHTDTIKNSTSVLTDDASVSVALIDKKVKRLRHLFKSAGSAIIDSKRLITKEEKEADPNALSIKCPLVLDEEMFMAVQKKEVCMYA
jgi:hypothetical protein